MSARVCGAWLVAAALLFWLSWALMPAVGITDARRILEGVGEHRGEVSLSAVVQLVSAACYAPALVGIAALRPLGERRALRGGAILLLVGAMGSAADAVFHLLAYEMAAPGVDRGAMLPVMERMQGPDLRLVAPMIASFFLGSALLAVGAAHTGLVARANPGLLAAALVLAVAGGAAAAGHPPAARAVGLGVLAFFSASQAWIGAALWRSPPEAA